MKKVIILILVFAMIVLCIAGCKKDKNGNDATASDPISHIDKPTNLSQSKKLDKDGKEIEGSEKKTEDEIRNIDMVESETTEP